MLPDRLSLGATYPDITDKPPNMHLGSVQHQKGESDALRLWSLKEFFLCGIYFVFPLARQFRERERGTCVEEIRPVW